MWKGRRYQVGGFGHVKELEERRRRDNYLMREIFYSGQMELVL